MPVLRKVAKDIDKDYEDLGQIIEDMYESMYAADGAGLAAPQIGLSIRIVVVDATKIEDEEDETLQHFKKVFINPHIIEEEGELWEFNEGCLSIPNIREDVKRKPRLRLKYMDENFKEYDEYFVGYKARIIQHELDHLNGVLFTDRISPLRKRLLSTKLKAISKGNTDTVYKIKFPRR
jgi:peptide deformylase